MPTDKKTTAKKATKKESGKKEVEKKLKVAQPTKFLLHISKCGTDTLSGNYKQIEHDNPIILGLNGVKIIADGIAPTESQPAFRYLLACAILRGLEVDKTKLLEDIKNIADRIKNLSLKEVKGGTKDGKP